MAKIRDLTFTQLQTALTGMGLTNAFVVQGGKVMLDVSALVGETVDSLDDSNVLEVMYLLRKAGGIAQITVNEGTAIADQMTAFPAFSYGAIEVVDGQPFIPVITTSEFQIRVDESKVFGSNT
ncbi:MAG TPA: hypothetical protein V6D25_31010 [Leptolyngbyaceae cyanobacterium]